MQVSEYKVAMGTLRCFLELKADRKRLEWRAKYIGSSLAEWRAQTDEDMAREAQAK